MVAPRFPKIFNSNHQTPIGAKADRTSPACLFLNSRYIGVKSIGQTQTLSIFQIDRQDFLDAFSVLRGVFLLGAQPARHINQTSRVFQAIKGGEGFFSVTSILKQLASCRLKCFELLLEIKRRVFARFHGVVFKENLPAVYLKLA